MPAPVITVTLPPTPTAVERDYLRLDRFPSAARSLDVTSRYLELDGRPWLPVMGEFHFSRYAPDEWEAELRKMRAGGIDIVASYVFWNHHEAQEGRFDWTGQRDLRRFVRLAQRAGLHFYLRPGPWVHAESRNGGFPDWLVAPGAGEVRCNDPAYLARVARFFGEIGAQLQDLMWRDGGPVIGVQLENEYDRIGPGAGAEHIAELKRLAIAAGLAVPLYTVTGWPTLDIPAREVVPVSGAYPDGFWSGAEGPLPPSGVFLFNTSRSIGEMGNVGGTPATEQIDKRHYPFFLAEAGGGMHVSYHRRPVVSADDLVATCLVQIGSGANLYGYYMYHGGTNPGRGLQETQDSGYPNDVPELGYDFRAPLGQYGQRRESYGRLRTLHLFAAAFGAEVATFDAVLPAGAPTDPSDLERPRVSVRGAGASGFVFVNNHVRHYPMPDFDGLRLRVEGPAAAVDLPPLRVPAGASFILPVGQRIGGARLRHATLQPLTRLVVGGRHVWVLFADGVNAPQLSFEADSVGAFDVPQDWLKATGDEIVLSPALTDAPCWIHFSDGRGDRQSLLLLTSVLARQAHVLPLLGSDRLVLSEHGLYAQDDETLVLQSPHDAEVTLRVFPGHDLRGEVVDDFAQVVHRASTQAFEPVRFALTHDEQRAPGIRLGPVVGWRGKSVPQAPDDAEFEQATRVALTLDTRVAPTDGRLLVEIDYIGDAARLYADGVLVDDHFYDGEAWIVGLDRHAKDGAWPRFELRILAARADLPVFLEDAARRRLLHAPRPAEFRAARTTLWCTTPLNFQLDAAAVDNNE